MAKPAKLPRWAETAAGVAAANIVEPPEGKKDTGFGTGGDVPTSGGLNWLFAILLAWCKWVSEAVSTATASTLVVRDAAGRAQFADPSANSDVDTLGARIVAINAHASLTAPHSAASAATASRLAIRDAAGRAQFADPAVDADADTKGARDAAIGSHSSLTAPHSATSAATASRLVLRDASGRAQFAPPAATADAATMGYVDGGNATSDGKSGIAWASGYIDGDLFSGSGATAQWTRLWKHGGIVTLNLQARCSAGAASAVATLPAGFRPGDFCIRAYGSEQTADTTFSPISMFIDDAGIIRLPAAGTAGRLYSLHVTFKAGG